jgi:hypothetical protein
LNHAAQCGYLAAIDKDLVQKAVEELSRSHSGIVNRLNAKVGVVTKKRTHEDLSTSLSQTPGDPAPPLKRSKTEPLLAVDKTRTRKASESKQVIHPGQNFAEMFQMEGKKALKEKADQALVKISRENFRSASNSNKKGKLAFGLGELERQTDECYDIKTLPI